MTEIEHAMSQLAFIQDRFAASTRFRGLAPQAVGATAVLATAVAAAQSMWPTLGNDPASYVWTWIATAIAAAAIIGVEALERSRRLHAGMADAMLAGTLRLLLPFGAAGAVVTLVIARAAPELAWVLPGLWQMLVALIGFSSVGTLPRAMLWPAGWYFLCGTTTLLLGAHLRSLEPWTMGVPFGVGQGMAALVLYRAGAADGGR